MTIKLRDARLFMLLVLLAVVALAAGCSGTRNAYKAAEGVDETAKVMTYQYTAIVHELNRMRSTGALKGEQLERSQEIVRTGTPIVQAMSAAAITYENARAAWAASNTAETQAEVEAAALAFQAALSDAAIQIAALIDLLQHLKGG
jgi:hypothetical protein